MNECSDCNYFVGWDDSDGTPYCDYEKGIENCPYDKETEIKNNGTKAEYIERKALENAMAIAAANGKEEDCHVWARAICLLHDVQTADVVPVVHGRWIEYPRAHYFKCSNCKYTVPHRKANLVNGKREYNYCPHCGAKMDWEG